MRTTIFTAAGLVAGLMGSAMAGFGEMPIERDLAGRLMPRVAPTTTNLQTFTGALGGAAADPILSTGDATRPFKVGDSTFTDFKGAFTRSCNNQHNACAELANAKPPGVEGGVPACDTQQTSCSAALASATQTAFPTLESSDANFDYFCDP